MPDLRRPSAAGRLLGVVVLLLLTGCSGSEDSEEAGPSAGSAYVALGDSYTAAPGVPETDPAGGCFRSSNNYPHLLAAEAGLELTDVSCSGATSEDVTGSDGGSAQLDAVSDSTELVTIGIGGNDANLFATLLGACAQVAGESGSPCADSTADTAEDALSTIEGNVADVVAAIDDAAPRAEVVVVGYPRLLPETGSCPELAPFAPGDYAFINSVNRALGQALRSAADASGADFVDVYAASAGHDICAEDPWINGAQKGADGTFPFHPFATEQRAVADLISQMI